MYTENELAKIAVNILFNIHKTYGPGLFESVYEEIFCFECGKIGLLFTRQQAIPLIHETIKMEAGFRADVIVDRKLLLEFKSIETLAPVHFRQAQTYLKLANLKLGLLVNFNVDYIKDGIHRIVNRL